MDEREILSLAGRVGSGHMIESALVEQAISGKGAFRRFKDVLAYHESEQERWLAFTFA